MIRIIAAAALLFVSGPAQEGGSDRIVTAVGEEIRGSLVELTPDGLLVLKRGKGRESIPVENIQRMYFEDNPRVTLESGEKLSPRFGGVMTGIIASIDGERVTLKAAHGTYSIRRDEVRSITLGRVAGEVPDAKEGQDQIVLKPTPEKPSTMRAVSGRVESIDAENVRMDGTDYPRPEVRAIRFRTGGVAAPQMGLFARVQLKNGDGLVGTLRKVEAGRILLFTHYAGVVAVDKTAVHSVAFVSMARMQMGHIMVCDQAGVREIDREGKEVWRYGEGAVGCLSARKLANGNVLIANPNSQQVLEVRPTGLAGGQVVWQMEGLPGPWDAQRLENGNVLVAESYGNRIAEYDPKDKSLKWSATLQANPTSVERLDDGNTLVSQNMGLVVEVDPKGAVAVTFRVSGMNEYRGTRTASGTTLIADQRGAQVVEVDRKGAVVWKKEIAQPRMAVRLDDGNTLILDRRGVIIEVDPQGTTVRTFGNFARAAAFSVY
ncbi:MAG TPA: PQQ-binding-like beta-propeller repeat protein [Planctomycetota bacterium]